MVDGHIHIERGPYTIEWIQQFVDYAQEREITELHFLEHTHRFHEFAPFYNGMTEFNSYQWKWYFEKERRSIAKYLELIALCRSKKFPVILHFGLEACYDPDFEESYSALRNYDMLDFVVGAVHWVDGFAFDHKKIFWEGKDVNKLYRRYYDVSIQLAQSGLFDGLAHPDGLKCFGHIPTIDLDTQYRSLAVALRSNSMYAENNVGINLNYGYTREIGLNSALLAILQEYEVPILSASDAHSPQDIGSFLKDLACMK